VKRVALLLLASAAFAAADPRVVELPGKSPLVTLRFVFTTGSAADPEGKPGVAHFTGEMLGDGGTKNLTYKQIVDAMYPMATSVDVYSDNVFESVDSRRSEPPVSVIRCA